MKKNDLLNSKIYRKKISIKDIFLMSTNPRFTLFDQESLDFEGISNTIHKQKFAVKKLLSSEGSFDKMLNLITSLIDKGFSEREDTLPYVLDYNNLNKYVVLEGNRRLFALKAIAKDKNMIDALNNIYNEIQSTKEIDDESKTKLKNIKKIMEEINLYAGEINKDYQIDINYVDYKGLKEDQINILSNEIIELLASRHSYAESSSKKEWSRIKMFYELKARFINTFNNYGPTTDGDKLDYTYEKLRKVYKRTKETIRSDVWMSFYLTSIINNYAEKNNLDAEELAYNLKSSPIELSLSKVRNIKTNLSLRRELSLKTKNISEKKSLDKNFNLLEITNSKMNLDNLSDFVIYSCLKKIINTRDFDICRNGSRDKGSIKKYAKLFNLTKDFTEQNLICKRNINPLQQKIEDLSKSDKLFSKSISDVGMDLNDESLNDIEIYNTLIEKSKNIYSNLIKNNAHLNDNVISVMSSAIIKHEINNSRLRELQDKIEGISDNGKDHYKKSLLATVKRLIYFEINALDENLTSSNSFNYEGALYYLAIVMRSSVEMIMVYSGYFLNEIYLKVKESYSVNINPLENYGYNISDGFPEILIFNNDGPKHNINSTMGKIKNKYDELGYFLPPYSSENNIFKKIYEYWWKKNFELSNKIIHRTWSVSYQKNPSTKFRSSFMDLNVFIEETFNLVLDIIELSIEWIDN